MARGGVGGVLGGSNTASFPGVGGVAILGGAAMKPLPALGRLAAGLADPEDDELEDDNELALPDENSRRLLLRSESIEEARDDEALRATADAARGLNEVRAIILRIRVSVRNGA